MIFFLETASNGCASPKLESVIINSLVSASFAGIPLSIQQKNTNNLADSTRLELKFGLES
jgi:hypothetical protein